MARWNELLVGRYNRFAQKLFSMKGESSLNQLDNVLQCVLPLFYGAENRYLEGWDLFGRSAAMSAPGAGNASFAEIRNPVASNTMIVVTRLATNESVVDQLVLTLFRPGSAGSTVDQPTVRGAQAWDGRGRGSSTAVVSDNSGAAGGGQAGGINILIQGVQAATNAELITPGQEIPLSPGSALTLSTGGLNTTLTYAYWWRERAIEDSELK